jgi:hypothetical protein
MNDRTVLAKSALGWLVPLAVVAVASGYEMNWGRAVTSAAPPAASPATQPPAVALLPEYKIEGGLEARKETVERTLFNPTRRPAPPATQTAAASAMPRGQYTLTGTSVVGNVATAFLRETNGGKSRSVRQGETLNGLLVAEVKPNYVRLKQGDEFEDLQLKVAAGPKTTVQPPPVAAAPQPAQVAQQPGAPNAAATGAAPASNVAELLANRRRAARAAAAAAAGGSGEGAVPQPAPPAVPQVVPQPQSRLQPQGGDPHWNVVYQRMVQQREQARQQEQPQ